MPDLTRDQRDLLLLGLVPGLGSRLTAALLERFGSPGAVLAASPAELREVPYIGEKLAQNLHRAMQGQPVAKELELLDEHGVSLLELGNPAYPATLAEIYDPPHLFYVRGALEPCDAKAIAVVGSRHCTAYGRRVTERLSFGLAQAGYTIVSGLARGIDGTAHRTALQAKGRTIAVLAGGLSRIYPPEHAELAEAITESGCLLSEAPMSMEPLANMFIPRNRVISALTRGVVVVEAAERSGALSTARHAAEQGRPVFAVPGPVDSPASAGTLRLIRDGAILVRNAADVVEELEGIAPPAVPLRAEPPPILDGVQKRIWEFLAGPPRHVDELSQGLSLSVPEAAAALMSLEMKKAVKRLPGNRYERC